MTSLPPHLEAILGLARWAPSGDNTQPWRFEVLGEEHVLVHGLDTRDHVVYDLDGHASQLALGALLETLRVAASGYGRQVHVSRRPGTPDTHLLFDVRFEPVDGLMPDPLLPFIEQRVVQRRAMSTQPLTHAQKASLSQALPDGYRVLWYESFGARWKLARFMFDNAMVRLIIPEGYAVHRQIIEWSARYSEDRIPEQAVGVDVLTARLMRWAMASWSRLDFLNTYLFGHFAPRVQLDLVPGVRCAAHCALLAPRPLVDIDDYIAAGGVLQRFWLTATGAGLFMQPEMTPVIFTRYHRQRRAFTQVAKATQTVARLNITLKSLLGSADVDGLFFMGRVGVGPEPWSRSTRKPLMAMTNIAGHEGQVMGAGDKHGR